MGQAFSHRHFDLLSLILLWRSCACVFLCPTVGGVLSHSHAHFSLITAAVVCTWCDATPQPGLSSPDLLNCKAKDQQKHNLGLHQPWLDLHEWCWLPALADEKKQLKCIQVFSSTLLQMYSVIQRGLEVWTHSRSYVFFALQHSPGKRQLVCHSVSWNVCDESSSGFQSKCTPTVPAGLFVQPAWYLDAGGE